MQKSYTVILHGRNEKRCEDVKDYFRKKGYFPPCVTGDLAELTQVRQLPEKLKSLTDKIDVLINNAGIYNPRCEKTSDGFEKTFQVNHLSHFLLTNLLLKSGFISSPGRIITVSSMAHASSIDFENLNCEKHYDSNEAYSTSKLCNILFAFYLADMLKRIEITSNALHPGVINTKLLISGWGRIGNDVSHGAETSVYLSTSSEVKDISGSYFVNKKPSMASSIAYNKNFQGKCWQLSLRFVGEGQKI